MLARCQSFWEFGILTILQRKDKKDLKRVPLLVGGTRKNTKFWIDTPVVGGAHIF